MGQEGIERIKPVTQAAFDVIDRVDQARIHFDLTPTQNADAARFADARLVVAVDIGAHGEFRFFLGGVQKSSDVFGILNRVAATRDGAGNRAGFDALSLDPDIHLG